MKDRVLAGSLLFLFCAACRKDIPAPIPDLIQGNNASVFVFLAPDCPLSQNYTLTLNTLQAQFRTNSVGFYGVVPGDHFQKEEIDSFVRKYKIDFPVLPDRDLDLAEFFDATKTPEVFAADSEGKIVYRGAIDNWADGLGQHRQVITANYLLDALGSVIRNEDVQVKATEAVGCFIERRG